ncbi:hypothetical protein ACFWU3_26685 [Streptomyces sp. NPDC058685]|uniref:hypothetical protein n=1 Tax=Streptomyces sp. NPDC058685 TaxID=3346598 RepID=UPI00366A1B92
MPDGITLEVDSCARAAEILFGLLPLHSGCADDQVYGIPGLRITSRTRTGIELSRPGPDGRLRLTGLPASAWRQAEEDCLEQLVDRTKMLLCWRSSPRARTPKEQELEDHLRTSTAVMARTWKAGTWLGSGLLRRLALFHTRSTAYAVDGYRGTHVAYVRWCVRIYLVSAASGRAHRSGKGSGNSKV